MNRTLCALILALGFAALIPSVATGQPPVTQDDPKIRNYIAWRLVDYLQLSEEQSSRLFPLWRDYSKSREDINRNRRDLFRTIAEATDDSTRSDSDMMDLLKKYRAMENREIENREAFFKNSRKILNDRQYVRLYTFDERLLEDLMRGFNRPKDDPRDRD